MIIKIRRQLKLKSFYFLLPKNKFTKKEDYRKLAIEIQNKNNLKSPIHFDHIVTI